MRTKRIKNNKRLNIISNMVFHTHGAICNYCSSPLVRIRWIRKNHRLKIVGGWIRYWDTQSKRIRISLVMTLDHIIPLAIGGTNDLSNLVPCCSYCNRDREIILVKKLNYEK